MLFYFYLFICVFIFAVSPVHRSLLASANSWKMEYLLTVMTTLSGWEGEIKHNIRQVSPWNTVKKWNRGINYTRKPQHAQNYLSHPHVLPPKESIARVIKSSSLVLFVYLCIVLPCWELLHSFGDVWRLQLSSSGPCSPAPAFWFPDASRWSPGWSSDRCPWCWPHTHTHTFPPCLHPPSPRHPTPPHDPIWPRKQPLQLGPR